MPPHSCFTTWEALVWRNSTCHKHLHAYRAPNDHPWSSPHGREETTVPTQHKRPPPAVGMTRGPHRASRASHLCSLGDSHPRLGSDPSPQGLRFPLSRTSLSLFWPPEGKGLRTDPAQSKYSTNTSGYQDDHSCDRIYCPNPHRNRTLAKGEVTVSTVGFVCPDSVALRSEFLK